MTRNSTFSTDCFCPLACQTVEPGDDVVVVSIWIAWNIVHVGIRDDAQARMIAVSYCIRFKEALRSRVRSRLAKQTSKRLRP